MLIKAIYLFILLWILLLIQFRTYFIIKTANLSTWKPIGTQPNIMKPSQNKANQAAPKAKLLPNINSREWPLKSISGSAITISQSIGSIKLRDNLDAPLINLLHRLQHSDWMTHNFRFMGKSINLKRKPMITNNSKSSKRKTSRKKCNLFVLLSLISFLSPWKLKENSVFQVIRKIMRKIKEKEWFPSPPSMNKISSYKIGPH